MSRYSKVSRTLFMLGMLSAIGDHSYREKLRYIASSMDAKLPRTLTEGAVLTITHRRSTT